MIAERGNHAAERAEALVEYASQTDDTLQLSRQERKELEEWEHLGLTHTSHTWGPTPTALRLAERGMLVVEHLTVDITAKGLDALRRSI